jgi:SRSO17 transposase
MAARFVQTCGDYGRHFVIKGKDVSAHARDYLSGLVGTQRRKNIGRIGEDVEASNYQSMQQLISDSPWSDEAVMEQVAEEANGLLGGHRDSALYLDETSFVKKGDHSVGVQRQHCGRLGKVENCQVGVFACLGRGARSTLVDYRLFLPESWAVDAERCEKVKIPVEFRVHLTKAELALAMVKKSRARGVNFAWVGGDEVYGNNKELTSGLEDLGETFWMDIAVNLHLYLANPQPQAKEASSGQRGRPPKGFIVGASEAQAWSVAELTGEFFARECRWLTVRNTTKGPLRCRLWVKSVWQWDGKSAQARARLLIVRENQDGTFKYSLSNAPAHTSWERLGFMQAQRFWIERAFQDAKGELGMAQYEVRGWRGWHHHITMVCLAMLFLTKERLLAAEDTPLLSARDIVELLAFYLPRRNRTEESVLASMQARHKQRAKDLSRHRKIPRNVVTK